MPQQIPRLYNLAAAAYRPHPVPQCLVNNNVIKGLCKSPGYSLVLEKGQTPEDLLYLWKSPRFNPCQWRVVCLKPLKPRNGVGVIENANGVWSFTAAGVQKENLEVLLGSIRRVQHQLPMESHWFNTTNLECPESPFSWMFPWREDIPEEQVRDTLDQMQLVEEQWQQDDATTS